MSIEEQPQILCMMRFAPNLNGHGGAQRAWHLVEALRPHGKVHFVMIYRDQDLDAAGVSLASLEPSTATITRISIPAWLSVMEKKFGLHPDLWNMIKMRSYDAPKFSPDELRSVGERMPIRNPDIVFACRLSSAVIIQALMDQKILSGALKIVDFDDILSNSRKRHVKSAGHTLGHQGRALARIEARLIARSESRIARSWHGVSVCTDEDVTSLRAAYPDATVQKVPNVVDRDRLPPRVKDGRFNVLFAGNLSFSANSDGLRAFMAEGWPTLIEAVPEAKLTIVGLNPTPDVAALDQRDGVEVHANVPSLRPFYENCDVSIAPILYGSGTRIKILESMAYGRPVVSTSMGAEGMGLEHGRHLLLADTMTDFAAAIVTLARDPARRDVLADEARAFQQARFTPQAIHASIAALLESGRSHAARSRR